MSVFKTVVHNVDFCVIGGGISGMLAAISAARHGAKVALMGDRPVLGGNASSEIRMWICGAANHAPHARETGIIEEILLETMHRNPTKNYSIWDSILYEKVRNEPNIEMILNCSCMDATMDGTKIKDITGWQLTTQMYHKVYAKIFSDCSGDSILAPLTGAEYRVGRESRDEFGEDIAPEFADKRTMGMTCLIQGKETTRPVKFTLPSWAEKYTTEDLQPYRVPGMKGQKRDNFWYMELGGMGNSIDDSEELRDELLGIAFGMWDYIKNNCPDMDNWELDWVGFLPGKRESRRYVGDHILTQNDVRAEGKFDDLVAYGGWSMDDHHPGGFRTEEKPTIFHPAPCPYGIPYRVMYSKNIENLMFAGRNISATHSAMSSTRVMATCGVIGQAVGTAAAIAIKEGVSPRGVYENYIGELKATLMADDCYLPFNSYEQSEISKIAEIVSDCDNAENVRNGHNRTIGDCDNGCYVKKGGFIEYKFKEAVDVKKIRLVFDSDLNRETNRDVDNFHNREILSNYPLNRIDAMPPATITKAFAVCALVDGEYKELFSTEENFQRVVKIDAGIKTDSIKFVAKDTWGNDECHVYCFDLY